MARVSLEDPRYYLNRHIQWLEFNPRSPPKSLPHSRIARKPTARYN